MSMMIFINASTRKIYILDISFQFQEAQERAPSAVMSALVEKLRAEVAEKDKKHRAMGRALADLKK